MPAWLQLFSTGAKDEYGKPIVTASQTSLIVSLLSAGTFFGSLTAAPVGDILGRRLGMVASVGVFMLGVILQTAATKIPLFVAGRFFAGFGVGLISALVPLYQSETAPKWVRYSMPSQIGLTSNFKDRFEVPLLAVTSGQSLSVFSLLQS